MLVHFEIFKYVLINLKYFGNSFIYRMKLLYYINQAIVCGSLYDPDIVLYGEVFYLIS